MADRGYVGQWDVLAVGEEIDMRQIIARDEGAGDADHEFLGRRLNDARGRDGILILQGLDDLTSVDAEAGEAMSLEFQVDLFVLRAEQLGLSRVRHGQQSTAHALDIVPQLPLREAVGSKTIDYAVDIAKFVVEEWSLHAGGQARTDVGDLVAHLLPEAAYVTGRRRLQQIDEYRRLARLGVRAQKVERRRFLQFLLDPVGHLLQ